MRNIPVFSNRLDESTGIVEHVLELKAKKAPWHLRFAPKAKALVSFVQNLLSPLTRKEGVRGGQLSAFFQSAASVVVGISLLVGSTGEVQAACDPSVYDVCFHHADSDWSSSDYATLYVDFDVPSGKSNQCYEVVWHGLKRFYDRSNDRYVLTSANISRRGFSGGGTLYFSYDKFWWDPDNPWNNYGVSIYEGHYDWSKGSGAEWVRGTQVARVDFYAYQEAAQVGLNTSVAPFEFSQYFCTIDWDPEIPDDWAPGNSGVLHGYTEGYWCYYPWGGWHYSGDTGSPRFDYGSSCSYIVHPPPRTSRNTIR